MRQKQLWALGLSLLLAGGIGRLAPRGDGTTSIDDGQAAQIVGGQYCSYYTVHDECGYAAKFNPVTGLVLTYCPIEQDADYNPVGASGKRGPLTYCIECGVSCGSYQPLLVCGS